MRDPISAVKVRRYYYSEGLSITQLVAKFRTTREVIERFIDEGERR